MTEKNKKLWLVQVITSEKISEIYCGANDLSEAKQRARDHARFLINSNHIKDGEKISGYSARQDESGRTYGQFLEEANARPWD